MILGEVWPCQTQDPSALTAEAQLLSTSTHIKVIGMGSVLDGNDLRVLKTELLQRVGDSFFTTIPRHIDQVVGEDHIGVLGITDS